MVRAQASTIDRLFRRARPARMSRLGVHVSALIAAATAVVASMVQPTPRQWLAGDSHVHSHWSPGYDRSTSPPTPIPGGDALYSTPVNAQMARRYGLTWMVTTDHGGPNHSKLNASRAYAELVDSRTRVPDLLQFYGLELNMPAMDHHTLIVPQTDAEWETLFEMERRFDANEAWPRDPERNTEAAALAALQHMNALAPLPLRRAWERTVSTNRLNCGSATVLRRTSIEGWKGGPAIKRVGWLPTAR
jgi:hypothetical protein